MVPSASLLLLSLFGGAATLLAGVHSAPVEKDDHVEEMVTRCIVEVLLNGLSKANAPPINPQCKELLKKSNRRMEEDQDLDPTMMHLSESEEREKPQEGTVREEQGPNEEEFKRQAEMGEKWHLEGKQHDVNDNAQAITQGDSYIFDEAHKEETKDDADKRNEEESSYKRNYPSEEESKAKKHSEDLEHEAEDKKTLPSPGKVTELDYKRSGGQREENLHSEERENESKEEEDAEEEEEEEESSEKYHHSFHREYEDSSEREDVDTDKRGHKPRYYYRKPRLGNSSEYKRHHHNEKKDLPEESSEEEREFWDKRGHYPRRYYETGHRSEEKRNSFEMHGSEEMEGKSRNREHQDKWHPSREDSEEEDMRHHNRENEEKQHHLERKRLPDEPQKELRHHYEEGIPHSKLGEGDESKQHSYSRRDEKRHQHDKEHLQFELEEMPKMQNIEKKDSEQRFYSPEEGEREEKRHYPSVTEEELEERHHNERGKHIANKRTLLLEEGYPRSHYLVENVKRAVAPYIPYYQQFRWKNRHAEKKDDGNPFLESEEESRSQLNEQDFFPEYNDYELWEKKQLMDSLSHKHSENNNLERSHKFDVKRQYNKMDQLAHLLSNRKKSAEFPELYGSREDVKRGHIIRSGEGKLRQRPLTKDEEKELENLAAMDLELQKIAEKFNSNRQG